MRSRKVELTEDYRLRLIIFLPPAAGKALFIPLPYFITLALTVTVEEMH